MGRRAHRPDPAQRRQVEALAGYGVPEAEIAGVVGVDAKTLCKHYRHELDHGHTKANARVAENLYRKATGEGREAVIAAIFWLKTRAGWKETNVHELTGVSVQVITGVGRNEDRREPRIIEHQAPALASGYLTGSASRGTD